MTGLIDFAVLPPEVNSGRMYAGAGSGSMMAAAASWDRLAVQLSAAAGSYQTVIWELTDGPWRGPASASMAAAAKPYVEWMHTTAARAVQTADQARAAAAAYEQAFAAIVPPSVLAANRAALTSLMASNTFGQNTAAIAANQAEYAEMWAQDVAAMHDYAAGSAAAATLPPFAAPPQSTDPAGAGTQTGAVAQNTAPAGTAQTALANAAQSNPLQVLGNQVMDLANSPLFNNATLSGLNALAGNISPWLIDGAGWMFVSEGCMIFEVPLMLATGKLAMLGPAAWATAPLAAGLASSVPEGAPAFTLAGSCGPGIGTPGAAGLDNAGVSASLGRAAPLGGLSVPPPWGTAPQGIRLAATASPMSGWAGSAAPPVVAMTAPGGWLGGPVGSVVNTPIHGECRARPGSEATAIPQTAVGAAAETTQDRPAQAHRSGPAAAGRLSESERNELEVLREEMADLARDCDVMTRLMRAAER